MTKASSPVVGLKWVVGPVVVAALAGVVGHLVAQRPHGPFAQRFAALAAGDRKPLENAPAFALANATWAAGDVEAVKKMARFELDRLPESETAARARVFVRFGIVDTNPDGQAAVFNQACITDQGHCDHLKEIAERETKERLVAPGNRLPPYFLAGHPHVGAPP